MCEKYYFEKKTEWLSADLKDLLLQAVNAQRSLREVQPHAVITEAVDHVQVGVGAASPDGHRDAEDVDIVATVRLRKQKLWFYMASWIDTFSFHETCGGDGPNTGGFWDVHKAAAENMEMFCSAVPLRTLMMRGLIFLGCLHLWTVN